MRVKFIQCAIDTLRGKRRSKKIQFIAAKLFDWRWRQRVRKKIRQSEKINVVFVCHRPAIWNALKPVFDACICDDRFNIIIVAIPNKKQLPCIGFNHQIYETEGAEQFFKDCHCKVINGYNYDTKEWFDLKKLTPDFVFFQTPYNMFRPLVYQSEVVARYARILYVHYAPNVMNAEIFEVSYPADFFWNVSKVFTQNKHDTKIVIEWFRKKNVNAAITMTGYPRYDYREQYVESDSDNWNMKKIVGVKRVIWTPRWNTRECNCHFFDYKDLLLDYVRQNSDIDFIFRAHPQAFLDWIANGDFTENEAQAYKDRYASINNAKIDCNPEYLGTFYSSDFLISDVSSIIAEYFLTGKPIIYCHKTHYFNAEWNNIAKECFYWVHNWDELKASIDMLRAGDDPLYDKRQQIIKDNFYINPKGAGNTIKEIIKSDYFGKAVDEL